MADRNSHFVNQFGNTYELYVFLQIHFLPAVGTIFHMIVTYLLTENLYSSEMFRFDNACVTQVYHLICGMTVGLNKVKIR